MTSKIVLTAGLLLISILPLRFIAQQNPGAGTAAQLVVRYEGQEASIVRDAFGVPHIFASSSSAAFYAGGYAVAQDRFVQLERLRRDARGEIAEIEGAAAVPRDRQRRTAGYTEDQLAEAFEKMTQSAKTACRAYAAGINAYVEYVVAQKTIPATLIAAGVERPRGWTVTDTAAIVVLMAQQFGAAGGQELSNARVMESLQRSFGPRDALAIFNDLFWKDDPSAPTTIGSTRTARARIDAALSPTAAAGFHVSAAMERDASQTDIIEYAQSHGLTTKWGSYSWVIGAGRSVSGVPVLLGGPQMGFTTPSIVHEIQYSAPDFEVVGMGFPGVPGVLVGQNGHIAWTMTSGATDVVDIFAEKVDAADKNRYWYRGDWRPFQRRIETIRVRGVAPQQLEILRSVHGPIVGKDDSAGLVFSRALSFAGQELSALEAMLAFPLSTTLSDFSKNVRQVQPNLNFVAADSHGHIGYWHAGNIPIRSGRHDRRLPTPGTGEFDWEGSVAPEQLPQIVDPPNGYLVNWNNKPIPSWDNGDRPEWGPINHIHRISNLIERRSPLTFDGVADIARDISTNDQDADYLKTTLVNLARKHRGPGEPKVESALHYLDNWDNHAVEGSIAKTIFDQWLQMVREELFGEQFRTVLTDQAAAGGRGTFESVFQPSVILRVLQPSASSLRLSYDYLRSRTREDVVYRALVRALQNLEQHAGMQMNLWTYSTGLIRFAGLPSIPGGNRGTYIQVVELSSPLFRHVTVLPPGESEDPGSPHYGNQRELAGYWSYKPMPFTRQQIERQPNSAR